MFRPNLMKLGKFQMKKKELLNYKYIFYLVIKMRLNQT